MTLTTSQVEKDPTPTVPLSKETQAPMKKKTRSNAGKGVMNSDNPSGPPLEDVSSQKFHYPAASLFLEFFYLLFAHVFFFVMLQPITQEMLDMAKHFIGFRNETETLRSKFPDTRTFPPSLSLSNCAFFVWVL